MKYTCERTRATFVVLYFARSNTYSDVKTALMVILMLKEL